MNVVGTIEVIFEVNVEVVKLVSVLFDEFGGEVNKTVTLPTAIMISAPQTTSVTAAETALRAFTSLRPKIRGLDSLTH